MTRLAPRPTLRDVAVGLGLCLLGSWTPTPAAAGSPVPIVKATQTLDGPARSLPIGVVLAGRQASLTSYLGPTSSRATSFPESTMLALMGIGGTLAIAPYLRRKARFSG